MKHNLLAALVAAFSLAACSTTSPTAKLEQFTINDARQASALAEKNNRPAAKSCYDTIGKVLTDLGTAPEQTGLLYANEVAAELQSGYHTVQGACVGTLVLP